MLSMSRVFALGIYSRLTSIYGSTNSVIVENDQQKEHCSNPRPYYEEHIQDDGSGMFDQLLKIDQDLTNSLAVCATPTKWSTQVLQLVCKCLELSGHGVPWFVISGIMLAVHFYTGEEFYFNYGVNLLAVLIMDIVVVAPIKLLIKRPRPASNQGSIPMSVSSVDNYAFPSGHASRCVALAVLFCYTPPFLLRTHLWYIWGIVVSLSRVALGRHHVLDIGAGMMAGLVIFDLVRRCGLLFGV